MMWYSSCLISVAVVTASSILFPIAAAEDTFSVDGSISLTYFYGSPTDVDRDLTDDEYDELISLMEQFYTDMFPTDSSFAITIGFTDMTYTAGGNPHVFIDFDAIVDFQTGPQITPNDVLDKMQGANLQDFIMFYLYGPPPYNQLDNVQEVELSMRYFQNPTPSPTDPTPPPPACCSPPCFSETMTVQVLGKGTTPMKQLQVGDMILTNGNGRYEPVYAFGHRDEARVAKFLKIRTVNTSEKWDGREDAVEPLELTEDHMVLVNATHYIPARDVRVGDLLQGRTVTAIETTQKAGLYSPLTPSGTLLVNNIQASAYVSLEKGRPMSLEHRWTVFGHLSQHQFVHISASPIRMICMGKLGGIIPRLICSSDSIDAESGHPWFAKLGLILVGILDKHQHNIMAQLVFLVMFYIICGSLYAVECLVGSANVESFLTAMIVVLAGAAFLGKKKQEAQKWIHAHKPSLWRLEAFVYFPFSPYDT